MKVENCDFTLKMEQRSLAIGALKVRDLLPEIENGERYEVR